MKRKKSPNQKPFKFTKKKSVPVILPTQPVEEVGAEIGSEKNVSFAMSIALQMKKQQRKADEAKKDAAKKRPVGRNKQYSDADLKAFERKLIEARDAIHASSSTLKATVGLEEAEEIESDGGDGSSQSMRLDSITQLDQSRKSLNEIEDALRRIADGSYGVCDVCGNLIPKARLASFPFAKTCTACQSEIELGPGTST